MTILQILINFSADSAFEDDLLRSLKCSLWKFQVINKHVKLNHSKLQMKKYKNISGLKNSSVRSQ